MAELTVDMTYGSALFAAAQDMGKTKEIEEEAFAVLDVFEENKDFYRIINYPGLAADEKKKILKNIFEGRISKELLSFLYVLINNGRISHYEKIVKEYRRLLNEAAGISFGTVFSASPLATERIAKLEKDTSELLGTKVELENKIDKKLIGGIKILVDGKIIDASLRTRLQNIANAIS